MSRSRRQDDALLDAGMFAVFSRLSFWHSARAIFPNIKIEDKGSYLVYRELPQEASAFSQSKE